MNTGLLTRQDVAEPDSGSPFGRLLPRRLWRTPAGDAWGPLPELLLILTVVTGIVDAVSILALGRVFVANMTGNVVFAGFAITGAPGFSLGASLFALAGFLIGAFLGGRMTTKVGHDHALHLRIATVSEFALLAVALIVAAADLRPGSGRSGQPKSCQQQPAADDRRPGHDWPPSSASSSGVPSGPSR